MTDFRDQNDQFYGNSGYEPTGSSAANQRLCVRLAGTAQPYPELSSGLYKRSRVFCALRASGCGR